MFRSTTVHGAFSYVNVVQNRSTIFLTGSKMVQRGFRCTWDLQKKRNSHYSTKIILKIFFRPGTEHQILLSICHYFTIFYDPPSLLLHPLIHQLSNIPKQHPHHAPSSPQSPPVSPPTNSSSHRDTNQASLSLRLLASASLHYSLIDYRHLILRKSRKCSYRGILRPDTLVNNLREGRLYIHREQFSIAYFAYKNLV